MTMQTYSINTSDSPRCYRMNIVYLEENPANVCLCNHEKNGLKVAYAFPEVFHSLYMEMKYIIQTEMEDCKRLFKNVINNSERPVVEKEISDSNLRFDLMI